MNNIYQKLTEQLGSEKEISLPTEMEEVSSLPSSEKEEVVVKSRESSRVPRSHGKKLKKVKQVLQSWVENIRCYNQEKFQKDPLKKSHQSVIDEIDSAVQNIIRSPELLDELVEKTSKYSFANTLENLVRKTLALRARSPEDRLKLQSTYTFYFEHRQTLIKAAEEIYPEYEIGRIWA